MTVQAIRIADRIMPGDTYRVWLVEKVLGGQELYRAGFPVQRFNESFMIRCKDELGYWDQVVFLVAKSSRDTVEIELGHYFHQHEELNKNRLTIYVDGEVVGKARLSQDTDYAADVLMKVAHAYEERGLEYACKLMRRLRYKRCWYKPTTWFKGK